MCLSAATRCFTDDKFNIKRKKWSFISGVIVVFTLCWLKMLSLMDLLMFFLSSGHFVVDWAQNTS